MSTPTEPPTTKTIYVTRSGLPLSFKLAWPFQHATSGADFEVLHAVITLENSEDLRALVAVNLSATLREALASLEPQDTEGPIINALRKEVDCRQTEFLKSGKLVPLALSSRHYNFRLKKWTFGKAGEEEIARSIEQKVYWQTRLTGGDAWLGDPTEALYSDTTTDHMVAIAAGLAEQGLFTMARRYARALPALMGQNDRFESAMAVALRELEEKHVFERG
ncbi:MAG: hypothetical protein ABSD75_08295 [Terriglobales bacterium]|jgi:hypothetical protein